MREMMKCIVMHGIGKVGVVDKPMPPARVWAPPKLGAWRPCEEAACPPKDSNLRPAD